MTAAEHGAVGLVQLLLEAGAEARAADGPGREEVSMSFPRGCCCPVGLQNG